MKKDTHPILELESPWKQHSHNVWLASVLTLSRNIKKFKFTDKLDRERQDQTISLLFESLSHSDELNNPKLYRTEEISIQEKEFLLEHFLAFDSLYQAHGGEGFVIDDQGDFLSVMNVGDHMQLCILDTDQEIENDWNRLVKIEGDLSKKIDFAYNPRFGFLSADPSLAGTGLKISLYLHIPAIIHMGELPELIEKERDEEVVAVGLQGNASEMIGDILVAQNRCTLGLTEEYILTTMRMWATRTVVSEMNLRKKLMQNNDEQMKNKVTRALGLLTHSYQLELIEALNAISLVKLGAEIGWINCPPSINLNDVLFGTRRAHLLYEVGNDTPIPELPKKRAEHLHTIASQLKLNI